MAYVKKFTLVLATLIFPILMIPQVWAEDKAVTHPSPERERLLMDSGWHFALGHAYDPDKDFGHATGYFSYFAKAGYGDGPADPKFDDRAWRVINLPHDWAVELPSEEKGSYSHGYKPIGHNFPASSVGWYRKTFFIPKSDQGRRVSVEFDGVYRDSVVWVNGFYLGREQSGYNNFRYDITDYLNYGGDNTVSVRVDATMEEGWFYEGAGIYRHVWLTKTAPLHIDYNGTFVTAEVGKGTAKVTARVTMVQEGKKAATFKIDQAILDADGKTVATGQLEKASLNPGGTGDYSVKINVAHPRLWSIESPYLYKLVSKVSSAGKVVDRYRDPLRHPYPLLRSEQGFLPERQARGTQGHFQPPGPRRGGGRPARCPPIFPDQTAQGNGLQRLSLRPQPTHPGTAGRLRQAGHAGFG